MSEEKYTAIHKLHKKLTELGIPHTMKRMYEGWQITVPENSNGWNSEGDAVQHQFSYGNKKNLIELWGFGLEDPIGFLKVNEALEYFVKWHEKQKAGDRNG